MGNCIDIDKEYLHNIYSIEKQNILTVSKILNVGRSTIYRRLKEYKIPIRNQGLSHHLTSKYFGFKLTKKSIDFINGELLGDGNISQFSKYTANYLHSSKYKKYCEWLISEFKKFGVKSGKIYKRTHILEHKICFSYSFMTRSYEELLEFRETWYPDGKKVIPKDLKLTPLTCRQWYIGDGSLKKKSKYIRLAVCGFSLDDINLLVRKLEEINIPSHYLNNSINKEIIIGRKDSINFLNYIGKCPEEIKDVYGYKWDYKSDKKLRSSWNRYSLAK